MSISFCLFSDFEDNISFSGFGSGKVGTDLYLKNLAKVKDIIYDHLCRLELDDSLNSKSDQNVIAQVFENRNFFPIHENKRM